MIIKLDLFIIDSDSASRGKLKQAAMLIPSVGAVHFCADFKEALRLLNGKLQADLIFISDRFGRDSTADFVKAAKETKFGKESAYVLVKRAKQQTLAEVTDSVITGLDAMLGEPYSVDELRDIANLALKVKLTHLGVREEAAMRLLIQESMSHVDHMASLKKRGGETVTIAMRLKKLCFSIKKFTTIPLDKYLQAACDMFIEAPAPPPDSGVEVQRYGGVSKRIQGIIDRRSKK